MGRVPTAVIVQVVANGSSRLADRHAAAPHAAMTKAPIQIPDRRDRSVRLEPQQLHAEGTVETKVGIHKSVPGLSTIMVTRAHVPT
jgi:hypothetical protein